MEASVIAGTFPIGSGINQELKIRWDTQGFQLTLQKQGVKCAEEGVSGFGFLEFPGYC